MGNFLSYSNIDITEEKEQQVDDETMKHENEIVKNIELITACNKDIARYKAEIKQLEEEKHVLFKHILADVSNRKVYITKLKKTMNKAVTFHNKVFLSQQMKSKYVNNFSKLILKHE